MQGVYGAIFFSRCLRFLDYGDEPWKNTARDALKGLET